MGEPRACGRGACGRAWGCDDGGNRAFSERFPGRSVDMRSDDNAHRGTRGNVRPRFPCVSIGRVARAGGHCVERHRAIPLVSPLARLPNMYTYAYSPATGIEADRAAFDAAPRDENRHPADVLTLDQLHAEKRGDARRAFADVGNLSRLVSADRARKSRRPSSRCSDRSEVASARSRATAATDASTALVGEWDAPRARASADAVDARPHRRRDHRHAATDADSPRTPTVESPADVDRTVSDATDDTIPPGALTIQRADYRRRVHDPDHDFEMEEEHARQMGVRRGAVMHESKLARLVLWRDPARTALTFAAGVMALAAARAPGLVAEHIPVNPVVIAAYVSMAYLARANLLAVAFPRRYHGLGVHPEEAADVARRVAAMFNAAADAHDDLLSGRSNAAVLRAFLSLYAVAKLGACLNSTWWVAATLWCGAFAAPPALEARRADVAAARAFLARKVATRAAEASSSQRWGVAVVAAASVFSAAGTETRVVLGFAAFVAARVFRETHRRQMETFERAVKDASRRLSRAGSEFQAMMGSTPSVFLRRRVVGTSSRGASDAASWD